VQGSDGVDDFPGEVSSNSQCVQRVGVHGSNLALPMVAAGMLAAMCETGLRRSDPHSIITEYLTCRMRCVLMQ
jgi:hypothetical protein